MKNTLDRALHYHQSGQLELAASLYNKVLKKKQHYSRRKRALAHFNLGLILQEANYRDKAEEHYREAIELKPDYMKAHANLGYLLREEGKLAASLSSYKHALGIDHLSPELHRNIGHLLCDLHNPYQALHHLRTALATTAPDANLYSGLGKAQLGTGDVASAVTSLQHAIQLDSHLPDTQSIYVLTLNYSPNHSPQEIFEEHLKFAQHSAAPDSSTPYRHTNNPDPNRRLRIGYVSPDFHTHSVAFFIEPVLANHNPDLVEVFAYYNQQYKDNITRRLQRHCQYWRDIRGVSDQQVAKIIANDQIDILIDLAGHTNQSRLLVFAHKPAPLQVSWLGYPNTTGLTTMDYRITDPYADPPGMTEAFYTEKLLRLPECFSCFSAPAEAPDVAPLPALANGYITFGSFNNFAKLTPQVLALWARILRNIPNSRLYLKFHALADAGFRKHVQATFAALDIPAERLELRGGDQSQRDHLAHYHQIDIGLDPFPYNGTTTTCDALWMGVPVITLAGATHASRVGVSQMMNLGLPELIADSEEDYLSIAERLAGDPEKLSTLRAGLRPRMHQSPLMDAPRFTQHLEDAYRHIWKNWCQQQKL